MLKYVLYHLLLGVNWIFSGFFLIRVKFGIMINSSLFFIKVTYPISNSDPVLELLRKCLNSDQNPPLYCAMVF